VCSPQLSRCITEVCCMMTVTFCLFSSRKWDVHPVLLSVMMPLIFILPCRHSGETLPSSVISHSAQCFWHLNNVHTVVGNSVSCDSCGGGLCRLFMYGSACSVCVCARARVFACTRVYVHVCVRVCMYHAWCVRMWVRVHMCVCVSEIHQ
jgi:hypothetical protein